MPVRADVVGITLEVAPLQIVDAHVPPYESEFELHILRREADDVQGP
jgi:pyrimidine operon attenuation protein/uracil phosphoribosyltransferase